MPLEYQIDHERRLVMATGHGTLTDQDVFGYQCDVWSRPELMGYNELVDMTAVDDIALPSTQRVRDLAALSAAMDSPQTSSRFAIVAPEKLAFGLARMFQIYREMDPRSTKKVAVFRSLEAAEAWLAAPDDSHGTDEPSADYAI
jgi:hypothetical protein